MGIFQREQSLKIRGAVLRVSVEYRSLRSVHGGKIVGSMYKLGARDGSLKCNYIMPKLTVFYTPPQGRPLPMVTWSEEKGFVINAAFEAAVRGIAREALEGGLAAPS